MCTHFTVRCAYTLQCDLHTFHSVICINFTVWCAHIGTHFTVWFAHFSQCDVHTFHSVMCTLFTVQFAHFSQCNVHTFHIVMCTHFTVMCIHFTVWCAHFSHCNVHTFHSVMCTLFTVWCAHISQCDVHTLYSVMCTLFTVWCAHISQWCAHFSQCDVHTFHCVMCIHFTVWCAYISQCDVHTFHTTGGFLVVRYWHSSAAVTHTKALMYGTQQCYRTTWLRYDVEYNTASMFVKLDIRGFIPSYSSIIMSLIWSAVTGSDESWWDHVDCEAVPPMSSYFASPSLLRQVSLPAVVLCRKGMFSSCCFVLQKCLYFLQNQV